MLKLLPALAPVFAPMLALALAALPAAALACSPVSGYHVPTNLELAEQANLIVLGEVVSGGKGVALDPEASTITVHPLAALKGLLPGADIVLAGMSLAQPGDAAANAVSDPLDFGDPHPQALTGGCIRREFPLGARAVFFLERVNGAWAPAGGAFSRWAEDVSGPDAPWVTLANLYAQASLLPPEQGRAKLEEQHAALVDHPDDPQSVAMRADIERSLAGPSASLAPPLVSAQLPPDDSVVATGAGEAAEPAVAAPTDLDAVERAIDAFGD
jgi:hypothetical protein